MRFLVQVDLKNSNVDYKIHKIKDYKKALKKKRYSDIKYFERWFVSGWAQALSGGNGVYIIEQCKQCVDLKPKPRKL